MTDPIPDFVHNNDMMYRRGDIRSNNVAAFDIDGTLIRSDSGLIFMRTVEDWVPTTNGSKLIDVIRNLVNDNWTIVLLANQFQRPQDNRQVVAARLALFVRAVNGHLGAVEFNPSIYVALKHDHYYKPNTGMWDLFLGHSQLVPSSASFYCGDAIGNTAINPAYQWSDEDTQFAANCRLPLYSPEEILGTFETEFPIANLSLIFIMAADPSQYEYLINRFPSPPYVVVANLKEAARLLNIGHKVIVTGKFASQRGRNEVIKHFPPNELRNAAFLLFTRPVKPFATNYQQIQNVITGYANALDHHNHMVDTSPITLAQGIQTHIVRMN